MLFRSDGSVFVGTVCDRKTAQEVAATEQIGGWGRSATGSWTKQEAAPGPPVNAARDDNFSDVSSVREQLMQSGHVHNSVRNINNKQPKVMHHLAPVPPPVQTSLPGPVLPLAGPGHRIMFNECQATDALGITGNNGHVISVEGAQAKVAIENTKCVVTVPLSCCVLAPSMPPPPADGSRTPPPAYAGQQLAPAQQEPVPGLGDSGEAPLPLPLKLDASVEDMRRQALNSLMRTPFGSQGERRCDPAFFNEPLTKLDMDHCIVAFNKIYLQERGENPLWWQELILTKRYSVKSFLQERWEMLRDLKGRWQVMRMSEKEEFRKLDLFFQSMYMPPGHLGSSEPLALVPEVKSSEVGDVDQHTFHCPSSHIDVQPDQAEVQTGEVQSKEPFEESVDEVKSNASAASRGSAASTLAQFEPSEHAHRAPQRDAWDDMTDEPTDPSCLKPGSAYVPATALQWRVQQLQPVPEAMSATQSTREEAKIGRAHV